MTVHLIKLSVGVESVEHLSALQQRRLQDARRSGLGDRLWHQTRHMPRRAAELLDGGSIYWVIKGAIRARQRVCELEAVTDEEGTRRCRLILIPGLTETVAWPRRPFQGWRYLEPADAPPDIGDAGADGEMPPEMAAELRALGLI
ncbi:MAG: DUF1489 domain-containing protein [Alphaproteobacteria bacterium]